MVCTAEPLGSKSGGSPQQQGPASCVSPGPGLAWAAHTSWRWPHGGQPGLGTGLQLCQVGRATTLPQVP